MKCKGNGECLKLLQNGSYSDNQKLSKCRYNCICVECPSCGKKVIPQWLVLYKGDNAKCYNCYN